MESQPTDGFRNIRTHRIYLDIATLPYYDHDHLEGAMLTQDGSSLMRGSVFLVDNHDRT